MISRLIPSMGLRRRAAVEAYAFLSPALILMLVFIVVPVGYGFYLSFTKWTGLGDPEFIGLTNYVRMFSRDVLFRRAFINSTVFAICVVIAKNALGLLLALLLNMKLRGQTFFRTAAYLPVTMSFVVVGLLWSWMLNPSLGLVNAGLQAIGLGSWARPWLADPVWAFRIIIAVDIWKWTGVYMVLYLAGLQTIPPELYEAARVDGASAWARFWQITVPLLSPIISICVFLALSGALVLNFDVVYVMTGGGPADLTQVVITKLVREGFHIGNLGYSSAIGTVLFIYASVAGYFYMRARRGGTYQF